MNLVLTCSGRAFNFDKVHIFWDGHKILQNLHLTSYVVPVKSKVKISQNFVAFSKYMNFNNNKK